MRWKLDPSRIRTSASIKITFYFKVVIIITTCVCTSPRIVKYRQFTAKTGSQIVNAIICNQLNLLILYLTETPLTIKVLPFRDNLDARQPYKTGVPS